MKELFRPALFCLESLAHAVGNGAFIQGLVGLDGHFDFVAHAHQEESPLGTIYRRLSDQLIERLRVQLLSNRANSRLASLPLLQFLVQFFLKDDHIQSGRGDGRDVLHPKLPAVLVLARRQN